MNRKRSGWKAPKIAGFSLKTVLIIPFVLQIGAAVGLVGYLSFKNSQQAVNTLADQLASKTNEQINKHLEQYLKTPHLLHKAIASAIASGNLDADDLSALERQFWSDISISDAVDYVFMGKPNGDFIGVQRYLDGKIVAKIRDDWTAPEREVYEIEFPGDRRTLRQSKPYDPRDRPWYKVTWEAGRQTWSPIYTSASFGVLQITPTTPIYDRDNNLVGVLATNLILAQIDEFLNGLEIGKTGAAFIVERSGDLVASSTAEKPFAGTLEDPIRLQATDSKEAIVRATTREIKRHFSDLNQIREPRQFSFILDGERQRVRVTPMGEIEGLDWLIVAIVPEADFMSEIYANNVRTALLCAAALGVAIAVGILTARQIADPILQLNEASHNLAEGRRDRRVPERGIKEVKTLARSFNRMAAQLQEAFETLEDKVEERTVQLADANRQISDLNEQLKADNIRMRAELDILRTMQQLILPKPCEIDEIEELDIAGYMEPADEVGGDYYDILYANGIVTLGIGDVTGHGLESGILMVMTQAAVRTLKETEETDPVKFLDTINRTIYKNVLRMNSDKNLTLAILNYTQNRIGISGQHEEVIVARKGGTIERIDTMDLGLPLGMDDQISEFINQTTIELEAGDGIVLYTDGITEAFNPDREQYGLDKLCEVIRQNWSKNAEEIQRAIVGDVKEFMAGEKQFDDITLLVVKQK